VEGTRSRGRQPKKWMDNVKEGLAAQGMNMREAVDKRRNSIRFGDVMLRPFLRRTVWSRKRNGMDSMEATKFSLTSDSR